MSEGVLIIRSWALAFICLLDQCEPQSDKAGLCLVYLTLKRYLPFSSFLFLCRPLVLLSNRFCAQSYNYFLASPAFSISIFYLDPGIES